MDAHQSFLADQEVVTEVIGEHNDKHNGTSIGTGASSFLRAFISGFNSAKKLWQEHNLSSNIKNKVWTMLLATMWFWQVQRFQRERFVTAYVNCLTIFTVCLLKVLHLKRWNWSKLFNLLESFHGWLCGACLLLNLILNTMYLVITRFS